MTKKLDRLLNVADYEKAARRRLPVPIFDMVQGGAGDEVSMRANRSALDAITVRPKPFVDITTRSLHTEILGVKTSMPIMLDPCGYQRLVHRDAEFAVARAAGAEGAIFALSTVTSYPLEDVARVATGPRWFQLYLPPGPVTETEDLVRRADEAGYDALCLTVDTTMRALRERDARHNVKIPIKLGPGLLMSGAVRPGWALDFVRGGVGRGNSGFNPKMLSIKAAGSKLSSTMRPVTLDDLKLVRKTWKGPLVVKGVLRADEVDELIGLGVDGFVVSNHGGRQLDSTPATITALPEVVDAAGGRAEVFLDGGIRRGTDVVKALALGAKAVLVGRPYIYGLAVAGEEGVRRVIRILRDETENAMGLTGCRNVAEITRDRVRIPGEPAPDFARQEVVAVA